MDGKKGLQGNEEKSERADERRADERRASAALQTGITAEGGWRILSALL